MLTSVRGYCVLAVGAVVLSCSLSPPLEQESAPGAPSAEYSKYVIVCMIHGDGGYSYHDTTGKKYKADEEALAGAIGIAERNPRAEVFIFHEKRRRHFLLLFPRRDGEFYCYRNGRLIAKESYWRDHGDARFDSELELYRRLRTAPGPQTVRLFLYFGHEIAEMGGRGYDASYRNRSFVIDDLAFGLKSMGGDSTKFDLVVLSTCYNGTPHTIAALSPYARYIIASPGNLHRSYFDMRSFEALDERLNDTNMSDFARICARESFERLQEAIQTEITVAVYDVERVQPYIRSVDSAYGHALAASDTADAAIEHCDCADDSTYVRPEMSAGVDVYFRAARFGRSARKESHSGWGCVKLPH